jgi:hypothetical protein
MWNCRLRKTHGRAGNYYGMVKTHKWAQLPSTEEERLAAIASLKLRPICPGYRSIDSEASKHITRCLQVIPRPPLSIANAQEVLHVLTTFQQRAKDVRLLSIDVCSMYPSIPVEAAVELARGKLDENRAALAEVSHLEPAQIIDLLSLSIRHTYAVVDDDVRPRFFRQRQGLAMGKAYAPVLADLYMGKWEERLFELAFLSGGELVFAVRYMDDYLLAFRGSDDNLNHFLATLNGQEASIQVTHEMEDNGKIPFLDILITRTEEGFQTAVFRKPCNTNYAVPPSSFSDPAYRRAAIVADTTRAFRYCSTLVARRKELSFIHHKFQAYGYTAAFIRRAMDATLARLERKLAVERGQLPEEPATTESPRPTRISFPYSGRSFHVLRRIAAKVGLQLVSRPFATLGSRLCSRHKNRLIANQQAEVVYSIKCSCGQRYVGETKRELGQRLAEHIGGWSHRRQASAFGNHADCQPAFDDAEILAREPHPRLRQLTESSFIRSYGRRETIIVSPNDACINRNAGADLDDRWLPVLQAAERGEERRRRQHLPRPQP